MLSAIDHWFMQQEEPSKSCLLFLRQHILEKDPAIDEVWSYGMPFYRYNGKRFCYLWMHKEHRKPYIGFVDGNMLEHPKLLEEKRARMKIFLIDPEKDVPVKTVDLLLKKAMLLHA